MKRLLLVAALCSISAPVFADQTWDTCNKLAQDRVGPIQQSHRRHYEQFVIACLKGRIPGVTVVSSQRGRTTVDGHDAGGAEERIQCTSSNNGQKYCY
jgi:hypothetical protein